MFSKWSEIGQWNNKSKGPDIDGSCPQLCWYVYKHFVLNIKELNHEDYQGSDRQVLSVMFEVKEWCCQTSM